MAFKTGEDIVTSKNMYKAFLKNCIMLSIHLHRSNKMILQFSGCVQCQQGWQQTPNSYQDSPPENLSLWLCVARQCRLHAK